MSKTNGILGPRIRAASIPSGAKTVTRRLQKSFIVPYIYSGKYATTNGIIKFSIHCSEGPPSAAPNVIVHRQTFSI